MKHKVAEIRFDKPIDNPHLELSRSSGGDATVGRLVNGRPLAFEVEDDGPWLVIKGKNRTVLVPRSNIVSCVVVPPDPDAKQQARK